MPRKILFLALLLITCLGACMAPTKINSGTLLILNMKNEAELPRNYRSVRFPFKADLDNHELSRIGLDTLNISGSAQFSEKALEVILEDIHWEGPTYLVDLRQECHAFINGDAVSWYTHRNWGNIGKALQQVEEEESKLVKSLKTQKEITIYKIISKETDASLSPETISIPMTVLNAFTERELAQNKHLNYFRIPMTDHLKPSIENVDRFISFVRSLPDDAWVHFHCSAGIGRTTTIMVMFDMMKNAKLVPFDQILERQAAIGGKNLIPAEKVSEDKVWKSELAHDKYQFLKHFYDYCKTNENDFTESWSDYSKSNNQ